MQSTNDYLQKTLQNKSIKSLFFLVILGFFSIYIFHNLNVSSKSLSYDITLKQKYDLFHSILFTSIILIPFAYIFKNELVNLLKTTWAQFSITLVYSFFLLLVLNYFFIQLISIFHIPATSNPGLSSQNPLSSFLLLRIIIQVMGEELILFSIIFSFYIIGMRVTPRTRYLLLFSILIGSIIFGLVHLPTLDYNVIQCIIIGITFAMRTLLFLWFGNITICYISHLFWNLIITWASHL
ncbi:CPBP family intramembrane glutamic endopeptidase [Bacillus toyonensis]|uniref:CPBP family intramembrane glutamic endopeptidase n=1 Tax=Bacillus toyonensis TaxID=155322 RepID=UPI001C0C5D01|nr:CPBP family intramembrane metalloprotease [Bacillus toyonensis]